MDRRRLLTVKGVPKKVLGFPAKLWTLVNDEKEELLTWNSEGTAIVIKKPHEFARNVLPKYFKHASILSFTRLLNNYGFHKVNCSEKNLQVNYEELQYSNPNFIKNDITLLGNIEGKPTKNVNKEFTCTCQIIKKKLVKEETKKELILFTQLNALKQENEALWREIEFLKQEQLDQQQIVGNVVQLLMSLAQPGRPPNGDSNNTGVKRPYHLIDELARQTSTTDEFQPSNSKNTRLDNDCTVSFNGDQTEDGPNNPELHNANFNSDINEGGNSNNVTLVDREEDTLDFCNVVTIQVPTVGIGFFKDDIPADHIRLEDPPEATTPTNEQISK